MLLVFSGRGVGPWLSCYIILARCQISSRRNEVASEIDVSISKISELVHPYSLLHCVSGAVEDDFQVSKCVFL